MDNGYVFHAVLFFLGVFGSCFIESNKYDVKVVVSTFFAVVFLVLMDLIYYDGTAIMSRLSFSEDSPINASRLDYFSLIVGYAVGRGFFLMKQSRWFTRV